MSGNVEDMGNTQRDYKGIQAELGLHYKTRCNIDQSKLIEYSGSWEGIHMGRRSLTLV